MYKLAFVAVLALLMAGCEQEVPIDSRAIVAAPDGADLAIKTIAADWGMTSVPVVYWYGGEKLDCNDGQGWSDSAGNCWHGSRWIYDGRDEVILAAPVGIPLHFMSIAHEMAHTAARQLGEPHGYEDHIGHFFHYPDDRPLLLPGVSDAGDIDVESYRLAGMGL